MGEIKSVKVDNWGVFFLQKLQNFFNKTDYCDLTLQFRDNSQLKVHRLVLSACTDYFNVLEQTCEMIDDALIMPNELQADVVVPIVNFMYTGTLEFELKMYGKLLRTAKDMNMTVLLKLLEAHRRTMEGVNRLQRPPSPKPLRRRMPTTGYTPTHQQPAAQQRRLLTSPNSVPGAQRRPVQTKTIYTNASSSTPVTAQPVQYRQQIGSTSLIRTSVGSNTANTVQARQQYGNQSLLETQQTIIKQEPEEPSATSPFEQLRKGYNNNKRPSSTTLISPPIKKLNIEDVKEFAEQQRMRKQIAAEYGEDQVGEYESSMMEDDIHNDDDDDDMATTSAGNANTQQPSTSRQTQIQQDATTIIINQSEKPPTIVVKDSSNSKMNHAKIIKEVLRQYPHLVKSNKNIKLKIMPSSGDQPQKIIVKKEQLENISAESQNDTASQTQSVLRVQAPSQTLLKPMVEKPQTIMQQQSAPQVAQKHSPVKQKQPTVSANAATSIASSSTASVPLAQSAPAQKRRIDSKTMHALIALGAENTTGPWLCLRCGVNGRPISIPSYRGFRRHLINTHKESIDAALCEHCGWRSNTKRELHFHMEVEHKVKTTSYTYPQCLLCSKPFLDTNALNQHMVDSHPDENKQQCIYCNKIFARELQLYNHMKTYHKKQALEDGIIDYSDEEFAESHETTELLSQVQQKESTVKDKKESKIKILSDISLPSAGSIIKLESNNICTDISAQIGISRNEEEFFDTNEGNTVLTEAPKFVTADGSEMVLTDEQRQEIMAQLNQEHGGGGVVMVLNEPSEYTTEAQNSSLATANEIVGSIAEKPQPEQENELETNSAAEPEHDQEPAADDEVMEEELRRVPPKSITADEEFEDSQTYNDLHAAQDEEAETATTGTDAKKNTSGGSAMDESKESIDHLEWAENLISAHEMADQELEENKKDKETLPDDAINQKLKELTGDWSEDENDEEEEDTVINTQNAKSVSTSIKYPEQNIEANANKDLKQERTTEESVKKTIVEDDTESKGSTAAEDMLSSQVGDDASDYTNAVEPKGVDDDDLDTLMKNIHKEDAKIVDIKSPEKESDSKPGDDEKEKERTAEEIQGGIQEDMSMSNIKETAANKDENVVESIEAKKGDATILAENLTSVERGVLLEKFIGDEGDVEGTRKTQILKEVADTENKPTNSPLSHNEPSEANNTATKTVETEAMEVGEEEAKPEDINMIEHSTVETDGDKPIETENIANDIENHSATVTTSKPTISDADAAKTCERVKSLISEWGDDEDEDEEDGTIATTATTAIAIADEEQL